MVLIYQPPNAHVRISWILLRNVMAAAAVKKIYTLGLFFKKFIEKFLLILTLLVDAASET
jgi:hypothetical protein